MAGKQTKLREDSLEAILIESIHTLVYEKDSNVALNCFLETIGRYYGADRSYIFEFDLKNNTMCNTFEWCAKGIRSEKRRLQNVQIDIIGHWVKKFKDNGEFYIAAVEDASTQNKEEFELLKLQNIDSLMAAPLLRDGEIVGFLGVDNPAKHDGDMTLLRSVVDFVTSDLEKRRLIEELRQACNIDLLTGLNNRNEYMRKFNELKEKKPYTLGVVFFDLNGLKQLNDTYGHERGDAVIKKTAEYIKKHAREYAYRIGGDEFVIIWENMDETTFLARVNAIKADFDADDECSVAIGKVWKEGFDIDQLVKMADAYMYKEKQKHYRDQNYDRRRR